MLKTLFFVFVPESNHLLLRISPSFVLQLLLLLFSPPASDPAEDNRPFPEELSLWALGDAHMGLALAVGSKHGQNRSELPTGVAHNFPGFLWGPASCSGTTQLPGESLVLCVRRQLVRARTGLRTGAWGPCACVPCGLEVLKWWICEESHTLTFGKRVKC